jgi:hypothetical protein
LSNGSQVVVATATWPSGSLIDRDKPRSRGWLDAFRAAWRDITSDEVKVSAGLEATLRASIIVDHRETLVMLILGERPQGLSAIGIVGLPDLTGSIHVRWTRPVDSAAWSFALELAARTNGSVGMVPEGRL